MTYHFMHYFDFDRRYIPEEKKIEIARERAIEDLAKELMKHAHFELDEVGNVRGTLRISDSMVRHKVLPNMCGEFVKWLNDDKFVALINGKELVGHKDYWVGVPEGDINHDRNVNRLEDT